MDGHLLVKIMGKKQIIIVILLAIFAGVTTLSGATQAADIYRKVGKTPGQEQPAEQQKPIKDLPIAKPGIIKPPQQKVTPPKNIPPSQVIAPRAIPSVGVCTPEDAKMMQEIAEAVHAMEAKPDFAYHDAKWQQFFMDPNSIQLMIGLYMRCPQVAAEVAAKHPRPKKPISPGVQKLLKDYIPQ